MVLNVCRTVILFGLRPKNAAAFLSGEAVEGKRLVGPYTFLLVGCLLYSYCLGSGFAGMTDSTFTQTVWNSIKNGWREAFSLETVLIRSLPILLGASLSAAFAGFAFSHSAKRVSRFFVYIYGLQGIGFLLFALSTSALEKTLQRLAGSDNYIILVFLVLTLFLCIQSFRCLHFLIKGVAARTSISRVALYLAFPLFFMVPMPLAGFVGIKLGLIQLEGKERMSARRVPAVRLVETNWQNLGNSRLRLSLTAILENRSKDTFVLEPSAVTIRLYFISSDEFSRLVSIYPEPQQAGTYRDLEDYNRDAVSIDSAQIETEAGEPRIRTVTPGAALTVRVVLTNAVAAAVRYRARDWNNPRASSAFESKRVDATLDELAAGRTVLVQVSITDKTLSQTLVSDCFRVDTKNAMPIGAN